MKKILISCLLMLSISAVAQKMNSNKKAIISSIEKHEAELIKISDAIWALAETAFEEDDSSKLLADYAEANGFTGRTRGGWHANCFCSDLWVRESP